MTNNINFEIAIVPEGDFVSIVGRTTRVDDEGVRHYVAQRNVRATAEVFTDEEEMDNVIDYIACGLAVPRHEVRTATETVAATL